MVYCAASRRVPEFLVRSGPSAVQSAARAHHGLPRLREGNAMPSHRRFMSRRRVLPATAVALAVCGLLVADGVDAGRPAPSFDPLLSEPGRACGPVVAGPPALLKALIRVKTETAPVPAGADAGCRRRGAAVSQPRRAGVSRSARQNPKAQAYFNQGLRLSFGFNHAEAQRAFQAAQKLDPGLRHVLLGRSAGARPEHQRADDAGGQRAGAGRAGQGGGAQGARRARRSSS